MPKKNYLSREEQGIWEYIKEKDIIDNEAISQIFPEFSENKRNKLLHSLYKKGRIFRAKRDLYYNPERLKSFYRLALMIREGYIGLSSALRYYNLLEYEDFTIFVMTKKFQKKVNLEGTQYSIQFVPLNKLFIGFEKKEDVYISSIEKTIFDCMLKPKHIGFSNIAKAIYDAKIDWKKFIEFFRQTGNKTLRQRTGYILDLLKKNTKLKIPSFVFEFLLSKAKTPVKLLPINAKSIFNKKWKVQDNIGEKNILGWWY